MVGTSSVKFSSRYNNTVTFLVSTTFKGKVDLVFFLDKSDFRILSKGEFILGTEHADKKIIEDLCLKLEESYDKDLKDCVKVMGHIVDRKTVKLVNPNVTFPPAFPEDEVEESNFTIDGVLDRITQVGMENLTDDEKRFLEQYQKTL